jgi:hypothetical protein
MNGVEQGKANLTSLDSRLGQVAAMLAHRGFLFSWLFHCFNIVVVVEPGTDLLKRQKIFLMQ